MPITQRRAFEAIGLGYPEMAGLPTNLLHLLDEARPPLLAPPDIIVIMQPLHYSKEGPGGLEGSMMAGTEQLRR